MNTTTEKIVALPLRPVYYRHDALTVGKKLDLGRKNELWGIELPSNIIPALKCTEKKGSTDLQRCRAFAESMRFDGIRCRLPRRDELKIRRTDTQKNDYRKTIAFWDKNGIDVDGYCGTCWSDEGFFVNPFELWLQDRYGNYPGKYYMPIPLRIALTI